MTVDYELVRKTKAQQYNDSKTWEKKPILPVAVLIIGLRTLANGESCYDEEIGNYFRATSHFRGLMVVSHIYRRPFFVRLDDYPNLLLEESY